MTPDERQLLSGLFDRIHGAANQPRDPEAEAFIAEAVRNQPYAPYLLSQTVIVQDQALRAANERLQQLEAQVRQQQGAQGAEPTSFLGSLGKSIFGSGQTSAQPNMARPPAPSPWGGGAAPAPQQPYPPQQQGGPWAQQGGGFAGAAPAQGGGFLKGALGAAAGVAGGVLLADSISGLFGGHHNPFGIASGGMGGFGGDFGAPGGETVVNNYYDSNGPADDSFDPGSTDTPQDAADFGSDSFDPGSGGGDDSYNV